MATSELQRGLFPEDQPAPLPAHCQSRRTDPATSRLAALQHEASGKAGTHRAVIAEAVFFHRGKTSAELAHIASMDRHEVARRLPELEKAGHVRKGAVRECEQNGGKAVTWWPTEEN